MNTDPPASIPDDTTADAFHAWATDPCRTLEERYGILQLLEFVYARYYRGEDKVSHNFEADQLRREARRFNPAYQPVLDPQRVRLVANLLPEVKAVEVDPWSGDRPTRDLSVLRFLPWLENLQLRNLELPRLDILRHLPALRTLDVWSNEVEDYSDIASCRELHRVTIRTEHPWPILTGLDTLPQLTHFEWHGNGRSLIGLPPLPALIHFRLSGGHSISSLSACLRDFHQLPAMPRLEYFWGGAFYRLDGIDRYPLLRIACIKGFFTTLAPPRRPPPHHPPTCQQPSFGGSRQRRPHPQPLPVRGRKPPPAGLDTPHGLPQPPGNPWHRLRHTPARSRYRPHVASLGG